MALEDNNIDDSKILLKEILSELPDNFYLHLTPGLESIFDNGFDKRMLETGKYLGVFENDKLILISGIHVYSEKYQVVALENITTHPTY